MSGLYWKSPSKNLPKPWKNIQKKFISDLPTLPTWTTGIFLGLAIAKYLTITNFCTKSRVDLPKSHIIVKRCHPTHCSNQQSKTTSCRHSSRPNFRHEAFRSGRACQTQMEKTWPNPRITWRSNYRDWERLSSWWDTGTGLSNATDMARELPW